MKYFCGLIFLCAFLFSGVVLGADETTGTKAPTRLKRWPLENVEIKPSSQVTWGRLDNGLRYAIMPHAAPAGRISLRLLVTVGSLDEKNDERGYAHFVEHMAFNGTKHFATGEFIRLLQRQGAVFGPHVNATTTSTSTLYKLELPDNSSITLETGLRIFRDYADGILFDPAEVKRERGVILSEKQSRHTDEEAERLARVGLLYAGTLVPDRQPIGLTPVIENADAEALKRFYQTWYRPENMSVVIVGDINVTQAETLIRAQFASLAASGYAPTVPALGTIEPPAEPKVATHIEESNDFNISLVKVSRGTALPPTWGTQLKGLRLHSAFAMLARRLERLTQATNQTINRSSATTATEYGQFRVLSVKVSSGIDDWEKALAIAEQEIRRVTEHGFNQDELAYQKTFLRTIFRDSARTLATLPSANIAETIADSMEGYGPFTFTGENLNIDLEMVDRLTAADCQRAFREHWGKSAPRIFIKTGAAHIPSAEKVRAVYAASRQIPVDAIPPVAAPVFAYEDFGPAGQVVEKTHVADLDLWLVRFANGVRLNLKRTTFETGLVRLKMRIGTGNFSEPADKPGLRFWTGAWWAGGVGKHTADELHRLGDGLGSITTSANEGALIMTSSARTEFLPRALRELTAMVTDPAFRPDRHRVTTANLHSQLDPLWRTPEGPVQRYILPALAGKNPQQGFPDPEMIFARTLDEINAWIAPQLAGGAIEIAVAGDFEVDTVIAEIAKTFGTLPVRQPAAAPAAEHTTKYPPQSAASYYYYHGPAERPSTLYFYWPVRNVSTAAERRQLPMLALILNDRVRDEVRIRKGATYSSHASFFTSASYPGLACILCTLEVKPLEALQYCNTVSDLAATLEKEGITADELARAKAQTSATLQEAKTDNLYWLNAVLSEVQERPEYLADLRSAETDIAQTSVADLNALAHKYLRSDQAFRYIIEPDARMPKQN